MGQFLTEFRISLEYHDKLNQALWVGDRLKPQVRQALLRYIDAWRQFANIPPALVQDIIITGGNVNFNYTTKSDIDVHLVIDRNLLNPNRVFVDDYLQSKKMLWTLTHNIKVLGYPLEPYAQDISTEIPSGQGVYSIKNDKWLQKPVHGNYDFKNDKILQQKVKFYMHTIDNMIKSKMDLVQFKNLKTKIAEMRASSIQRGGEFALENLVFKELRNRGYLDKMTKYAKTLQDKSLSL